MAIFDREDIPSLSLFKVATPKSEFPQLIAGVRVVGPRVMASRLGGNPKLKSRNGKEFTLLATYPASPGRDNNLGLKNRLLVDEESSFCKGISEYQEGHADGGHWESPGKMVRSKIAYSLRTNHPEQAPSLQSRGEARDFLLSVDPSLTLGIRPRDWRGRFRADSNRRKPGGLGGISRVVVFFVVFESLRGLRGLIVLGVFRGLLFGCGPRPRWEIREKKRDAS